MEDLNATAASLIRSISGSSSSHQGNINTHSRSHSQHIRHGSNMSGVASNSNNSHSGNSHSGNSHNSHGNLNEQSPSHIAMTGHGFSPEDIQDLLGGVLDDDEDHNNNNHGNIHTSMHPVASLGNADMAPPVPQTKAAVAARSERKRSREKQRRSDINQQFAQLAAQLKTVEAEDESASVKNLPSYSSSNRVDLICRTIHLLTVVHESNKRRKCQVTDLEEQLAVAKKAGEDTAARLKEAMGVTPMPGQCQPQYQYGYQYQQPHHYQPQQQQQQQQQQYPPANVSTAGKQGQGQQGQGQVMMMVPMMMSSDGSCSSAPAPGGMQMPMNMNMMQSWMPQSYMQQQQQQQPAAAPAPPAAPPSTTEAPEQPAVTAPPATATPAPPETATPAALQEQPQQQQQPQQQAMQYMMMPQPMPQYQQQQYGQQQYGQQQQYQQQPMIAPAGGVPQPAPAQPDPSKAPKNDAAATSSVGSNLAHCA